VLDVRWCTSCRAKRLGHVVANIVALGLIALAAHSWPVREYVRVAVVERATQAAGAPVSVGHVRYNLATLTFEADDVAWSPLGAGMAAGGLVRHLAIELSWRGLLAGRLDPQYVLVSGLHLVDSSGAGRFGASLLGLSLRMDSSGTHGLAGHVRLQGPASIQIGTTVSGLTRFDGDVAVDRATVTVRRVHLSAPGMEVKMAGTLDALHIAAPRASLKGSWRADLPDLCATWLLGRIPCHQVRDGALEGDLRLEGSLFTPVLSLEAHTDRIVVGSGTSIALDGEAIVSAQTIEIPRLDATAFGGTASLREALILRDALRLSGASLTWRGLDPRALLRALGLAMPIASTIDGHAVFMGPLLEPWAFTVETHALLTTADHPGISAAGRVAARLDEGRWTVRVVAGRIGATAVEGVAEGRLGEEAADALATATLDGSVLIESGDLRQVVAMLRDLELVAAWPAYIPPEWGMRGTANLRLEGTLRRPRAAGWVDLTALRTTDEEPLKGRAEVRFDRDGIELRSVHMGRGDDHLDGSAHYERESGAIGGEFTATLADPGSVVRCSIPLVSKPARGCGSQMSPSGNTTCSTSRTTRPAR
jgi:hypothetical protein